MITKDDVRQTLESMMIDHPDFEAKMKFGSKGYELRGKLCAGVYQDFLVLNLGKDKVDEMLKQGDSKPMDIMGRVLEDWVMIEEPVYRDDSEMKKLIDMAAKRVRSVA